MLLSRGMHALAYQRTQFARDAADALKSQRGGGFKAFAMECLLLACERVPLVMKIFGLLYRSAESLSVRSRRALQKQFSHLLQK
jgi:hypothetical protein